MTDDDERRMIPLLDSHRSGGSHAHPLRLSRLPHQLHGQRPTGREEARVPVVRQRRHCSRQRSRRTAGAAPFAPFAPLVPAGRRARSDRFRRTRRRTPQRRSARALPYVTSCAMLRFGGLPFVGLGQSMTCPGNVKWGCSTVPTGLSRRCHHRLGPHVCRCRTAATGYRLTFHLPRRFG